MKTGEGKTFVAVQALYLNGLTGRGVHLVTVNDYLAKRDAEWTRPVYELLGSSVGSIENLMPFNERREAYACDVTYGTNSEFGFDYLRDNMAVSLDRRRPAQPLVRDRGRGRLDPRRRGADAAHHLGRAGDRCRDLLPVRPRGEGPRGRARDPQDREGPRRDGALGRRLPLRREVQDGLAGAGDDREGRARARDRQPLRPAQRHPRQPPHAGAQGAVALQARRRLRRAGGRGQDRRRVHRPDHGRPPLERGPAPGDRGEGGRPDPRGERHARVDHAAELLPPLREARRHDRYSEDRGEGVRRDLRPARRRDPDQPARSRASTRTTTSSRRPRRSSTRWSRTSSSATRPASRFSSARSRSRPPSTSPRC